MLAPRVLAQSAGFYRAKPSKETHTFSSACLSKCTEASSFLCNSTPTPLLTLCSKIPPAPAVLTTSPAPLAVSSHGQWFAFLAPKSWISSRFFQPCPSALSLLSREPWLCPVAWVLPLPGQGSLFCRCSVSDQGSVTVSSNSSFSLLQNSVYFLLANPSSF